MIQHLGTCINHIVSPWQIARYKLLRVVNKGLHGLSQIEGFLQNVVLNNTMSHVLIANVSTHSQRRILLGDGTIEIASSQNDTVETCCYLIILILYKHTLIGIEMGIGELIG